MTLPKPPAVLRDKRFAAVVAFVLFALVVQWKAAAVIERGLVFNWDMLGYVACALSLGGDSIDSVHEAVYRGAKEVVPKRTYNDLIKRSHYRRANYKDPKVFEKQLPFYRARILYNGWIFVLHRLGVQPMLASAYISVASWVLACLLIFIWVARRASPWLALPVGLGLGFSGPMLEVARHSTPDALCTLLVAVGLFVLIELRRPRLGLAVMATAMLARPDTVVFVLPLCLALGFSGPRAQRLSIWWSLGIAAGTGALFLILKMAADTRSWWVVLQFTTLGMRPNVDTIPTEFDVEKYWKILSGGFRRIWGGRFFVHLGLAFLGAHAARGLYRRSSVVAPSVVLWVLAASIVARFVLFPRMWDRLFAPYFLAVELILVVVVAHLATRGDGKESNGTGTGASKISDTTGGDQRSTASAD